jgi:hypothetical protein
VHSLLAAFLRRLGPLFSRRGLEHLETLPEDALDGLRLRAAQVRLPLGPGTEPRPKRRCAQLDGFNLHANTWVHENDRQGLVHLCRYGARGPLSLDRLSEREDGRLEYRLRRPAPDGSRLLVLTKLELLRRLVALLPPPGFHLTRFHGVFAPNARARPRVVTPPAEPSQPEPPPLTAPSHPKPRKGRVPWAELLKHSFGVDVLRCHACGGERRVLAFISQPDHARRLLEHLGLPLSPTDSPPRNTGPPPWTFLPVELEL